MITPYFDFFEECAKRHKLILHDQPVSVTVPEVKRKAFFRSSTEMMLTLNDGASFPALIAYYPYGKFRDNSTVDELRTGSFEIRQIVDTPGDWAAGMGAMDLCYSIACQIVAQMNKEFETLSYQGRMPGFDMNTVNYGLIGPILNNQFGCRVTFGYTRTAFNKYEPTEQYFNEL